MCQRLLLLVLFLERGFPILKLQPAEQVFKHKPSAAPAGYTKGGGHPGRREARKGERASWKSQSALGKKAAGYEFIRFCLKPTICTDARSTRFRHAAGRRSGPSSFYRYAKDINRLILLQEGQISARASKRPSLKSNTQGC